MLVETINECSIVQGSLILLINNERPTKSGFWRKVRGEDCRKEVYYVLEKPMHRDFNTNDPNLKNTHKENGLFIMSNNTLAFNHDKQGRYTTNRYDILVTIIGTDSVLLTNNNYDLTSIDLESKNVKYTKDFLELMKYYKEQNNKWLNISKSLIRPQRKD